MRLEDYRDYILLQNLDKNDIHHIVFLMYVNILQQIFDDAWRVLLFQLENIRLIRCL